MHNEKSFALEISRLDHVTIEVTDVQEALEFYVMVLGLEEMQIPEEIKINGIRWLRLPQDQALHLVETKDAKISDTAHLAISVEELEMWEKYLNNHNIVTHPPKFDIYKAKRFFFKDPFGNRIEFLKRL